MGEEAELCELGFGRFGACSGLGLVALWCLGGNGGMDVCSSPYIAPSNNPYNPFPYSLLSSRGCSFGAQACSFGGLGFQLLGLVLQCWGEGL